MSVMPLTCWQASPPGVNTSIKTSWGHGKFVPKKRCPWRALIAVRPVTIVAICSLFPPATKIIESEITFLFWFKAEGHDSRWSLRHNGLVFFIELFPPGCLLQHLPLTLEINMDHLITCHTELKPHQCLHERHQRALCPKGVMQIRLQWCALPGLCTIEAAKKSLSWFGENRSVLAAVGNVSQHWPVVQHAARHI